MRRVLSAWDEHFVHAGLPRILSGHLRDAGFTIRQRDVIPMFNPEYHDNTYAKRRAGHHGVVCSWTQRCVQGGSKRLAC